MADVLRDGLLYHSQDTLLASLLEELELKEQAMVPKQFLVGAPLPHLTGRRRQGLARKGSALF